MWVRMSAFGGGVASDRQEVELDADHDDEDRAR